jgi:pectate lyase
LLSDNFEDGTASAWTPNTIGDWSVVSDGSFVYRLGTLVSALRVASAGSSAWQNQSVQARMKVLAFGGTPGSSSYFAALFVRYTDENNHYYLALRSDGKLNIRRKLAGSNSSIGATFTPGQPITTGTWYTVKVEVIGTTLNAYVDGLLFDTVTDSSFASGKAGLGSTNASVAFDDVVVIQP